MNKGLIRGSSGGSGPTRRCCCRNSSSVIHSFQNSSNLMIHTQASKHRMNASLMNAGRPFAGSMTGVMNQIKRGIFMRDGLGLFPHVIRYPKDYVPAPKGWEHVRTKLKRKQRLTMDEVNALQVWWGADRLGLTVFSGSIILGSIFLAYLPPRLRQERMSQQMLENWANENAEYLEGTVAEDCVARFVRKHEKDVRKNLDTSNVAVDSGAKVITRGGLVAQ